MENSDVSEVINKISSIINNSNHDGKDGSATSAEAISNMIEMLKKNNSEEYNSESNNFNDIDFETILKFKTVLNQINSKDDKRSKLLLALKPYLKDSRKQKIDKYIQVLNISKVIDTFSDSTVGGDKK